MRMVCALHVLGAVFENWWQRYVCTVVEDFVAKVTTVINVTRLARATIVKVTRVSRTNNDELHNIKLIRKCGQVQMCVRVHKIYKQLAMQKQ